MVVVVRYHQPAMGTAKPAPQQRLRTRLRTSHRSPSAVDEARLVQAVDVEQPTFWLAVVADASVTARYRGEMARFGSRREALAQILRLCWVTESFGAQVCYRAKVACRQRGIPVLPTLLHKVAVASAQVTIGDRVLIAPGVYMPHGQVVIDGLTFVDTGVVLRPFVTLGLIDGEIFGPRIGARTMIGTGAKVIGPVEIGTDVQVGANALVNRDVPNGVTVVGVPAREIA